VSDALLFFALVPRVPSGRQKREPSSSFRFLEAKVWQSYLVGRRGNEAMRNYSQYYCIIIQKNVRSLPVLVLYSYSLQ
jgi:hypothetical protein